MVYWFKREDSFQITDHDYIHYYQISTLFRGTSSSTSVLPLPTHVALARPATDSSPDAAHLNMLFIADKRKSAVYQVDLGEVHQIYMTG